MAGSSSRSWLTFRNLSSLCVFQIVVLEGRSHTIDLPCSKAMFGSDLPPCRNRLSHLRSDGVRLFRVRNTSNDKRQFERGRASSSIYGGRENPRLDVRRHGIEVIGR